MFDDLFEEMVPNQVDCIIEIHELRERCAKLSTSSLIDTILNYTDKVEVDKNADKAISRFFNKGTVVKDDREILENCYIILENDFCISETGEVYATMRK